MNTNIFSLTFFGEYEYKYIWIQLIRQIQKQIYWGLPKMGKYENKYNCSD